MPASPPPPATERLPSPESYGSPVNQSDAAGRPTGIWQLKLEDDERTRELRFEEGYLSGLCRIFDGAGRLISEEHFRPRPDVYSKPKGS